MNLVPIWSFLVARENAFWEGAFIDFDLLWFLFCAD